jgi:hypothetical protein
VIHLNLRFYSCYPSNIDLINNIALIHYPMNPIETLNHYPKCYLTILNPLSIWYWIHVKDYSINKWVNWVNQHITNPYPSLCATCTILRKCHHTLFNSVMLHHSKPMRIYSHTLSDSYMYSNCNCATWEGIWIHTQSNAYLVFVLMC